MTGFESPATEFTQSLLDLDSLLIQHPAATYFGLAEGDSMTGVGIFTGDILIVSRAVKPAQGEIIVANLNGEFICRSFNIAERRLEAAAANIQPIVIGPEDVFEIEGVVISSVRMHRQLKQTFQQPTG
jgi:DNA polymerase V